MNEATFKNSNNLVLFVIVCVLCSGEFNKVLGLPRSSRQSKAHFLPGVFQPQKNNPEENRPKTGCLTARGLFRSSSCSKYLNCWDGVAVEQECPQGLLFNTVKNYCDYPANVDCEGDIDSISPLPSQPAAPETSSKSSHSVTIDERTKCPKPTGQFPSDTCDKFINCWDGAAIEETCPEGLLFSKTKGYCDHPQYVTCDGESPNKIVKDPECILENGSFRDPKNCSRYSTCLDGKIVAQNTCPQNLSFSNNLGVCDFSERVDCNQDPPNFPTIRTDILKRIPEGFLKKMENCEVGTVFPLNNQCTIAGICRVGLTEIVECPQGFAYDSRTDKCLLLHLARC